MKDADYQGRFIGHAITHKEKKKLATHPIFLYSPNVNLAKTKNFIQLNQVVNVYEHNVYDFELNSIRIIKHYKKYYGNTSIGRFTLGQQIQFRVYEDQEPISLSLFKFLVNYALLVIPVCMGVDFSEWKNWEPLTVTKWSEGIWNNYINDYIVHSRKYGNMREICEYIEVSKYIMNLWCAEAGDRIGLSISNLDFIDIMEQDKESYDSITCGFKIPDDITPSELEELTEKRTKNLIGTISAHKENPLSVYTRNGLFNATQFREFAVHMTYKPDLYGNTIPYTYPTNMFMGTKDPRSHMIDAYGGRKAEVVKLNVKDAGSLERSLSLMMSDVRWVDNNYECNSKHFRIRRIDSASTLNKLDGRVCTFDPNSDEYIIIDPNNTDLIGKVIYIKTPITCTHPRRNEGYICSACYGKLLSPVNADIHIGRISAFNSADDMEQTLLSAKHALKTDTTEVIFNKEFNDYFIADGYEITLNQDILDASIYDDSNLLDSLYLEFNLSTMLKHQDGESRHFDRSIPEIVIYNETDDTRITIKDENGSLLYLTPDFISDIFLPAIKFTLEKDIVDIPFSHLVDTGNPVCEYIFEFQYKNQELSAALMKLESILSKESSINSFETYNDCLDALIPLFIKGGINLPELQTEMLISQIIFTPDGKPVDWNDPDPEYVFCSINKAIERLRSAQPSIIHRETRGKISGDKNIYDRPGSSAYDYFTVIGTPPDEE